MNEVRGYVRRGCVDGCVRVMRRPRGKVRERRRRVVRRRRRGAGGGVDQSRHPQSRHPPRSRVEDQSAPAPVPHPRLPQEHPRWRARRHRRRRREGGVLNRRPSDSPSSDPPAALRAGRRRGSRGSMMSASALRPEDGGLVRRRGKHSWTGVVWVAGSIPVAVAASSGSLGGRGSPRGFARPFASGPGPRGDASSQSRRRRSSSCCCSSWWWWWWWWSPVRALRRTRAGAGARLGFREHALDPQGAQRAVGVGDGRHAPHRGGGIRELGEGDTLARDDPHGFQVFHERRFIARFIAHVVFIEPVVVVFIPERVLVRVLPRSRRLPPRGERGIRRELGEEIFERALQGVLTGALGAHHEQPRPRRIVRVRRRHPPTRAAAASTRAMGVWRQPTRSIKTSFVNERHGTHQIQQIQQINS